jgi:sugar-specific transcriptional regulator TrmB
MEKGQKNFLDHIEKLKELLAFMGLNKNEIDIYVFLVTNKPSSALEISSKTKIHRSNIYDSLRRLTERGFVSRLLSENKNKFKATDLEQVRKYISQKEKEFDIILPQLKNLAPYEEKSEINIQVSQGTFAARNELLEALKLKSPIYVYGANKEALETFGEGFMKSYHNDRIKENVPMYHIYNKNAMKRINYLNKLKLTEARYLSEKYDTVASTLICDGRVVIFIFTPPTLVLRIDNKDIASAYRRYFDILWEKTKHPKEN